MDAPAVPVVVSVAIMAHPRRAAAAEALAHAHPSLRASVVYDPSPEGAPSAMRAARLAWSALHSGATHHLVAQDDVRWCPDFPEQLRRAVASRPDDVIALHTEWGSRSAHLVRLAALLGVSWAEMVDPYMPAQAVVMPTAVLEEFLSYLNGDAEVPDDDALAMLAFLEPGNRTAYVSAPNLVEHAGLPSLLDNDLLMGARRSAFVLQAGVSPSWSDATVAGLAQVPHFSTAQGRSVWCVRDGSTWRTVPTTEWWAGRGVALPEQAALFRADVKQVLPSVPAVEVISLTMAFELWLTALCYGTVLAGWPDGGQALERAASDPSARRALSTLVVGGMRRLLPERYLLAAADPLVPLLIAGMRRGWALETDAPRATR